MSLGIEPSISRLISLHGVPCPQTPSPDEEQIDASDSQGLVMLSSRNHGQGYVQELQDTEAAAVERDSAGQVEAWLQQADQHVEAWLQQGQDEQDIPLSSENKLEAWLQKGRDDEIIPIHSGSTFPDSLTAPIDSRRVIVVRMLRMPRRRQSAVKLLTEFFERFGTVDLIFAPHNCSLLSLNNLAIIVMRTDVEAQCIFSRGVQQEIVAEGARDVPVLLSRLTDRPVSSITSLGKCLRDPIGGDRVLVVRMFRTVQTRQQASSILRKYFSHYGTVDLLFAPHSRGSPSFHNLGVVLMRNQEEAEGVFRKGVKHELPGEGVGAAVILFVFRVTDLAEVDL